MNSFDTYLLQRIYKKIAKLGDKLAEADTQIDWTTFRPIIQGLYRNDTERGGRPNADEVVMVKLLALQQWFGLKRRPVERTFAVLKRAFHAGHMLVTSPPRVRVKMVFSCLCFNLLQLGTLGVASAA